VIDRKYAIEALKRFKGVVLICATLVFVIVTGYVITAQTTKQVEGLRIVVHQQGRQTTLDQNSSLFTKLLDECESLAFPPGVTVQAFDMAAEEEVTKLVKTGPVLEIIYPTVQSRRLLDKPLGTYKIYFTTMFLPLGWESSLDGSVHFNNAVFFANHGKAPEGYPLPKYLDISNSGRGVDAFRMRKSQELKQTLQELDVHL
jgi:hypothetical protein